MIESICFLTTFHCNAQCDYCECGPDVKTRLSLADMTRMIDEGLALGTVGLVVFSGGEPTLLKDDLIAAIRYASARGLATRVVTNGWWGKTPERALEYLDTLIDAGLGELNISIDDLHQEWIPLESVKNAVLACVARKFQLLIAHKQNHDSKLTQKSLAEAFGIELVEWVPGKRYTKDEACRLISTGVVVPVGRNEELADITQHGQARWEGGCGSVLKDIIVGADAHFQPCCGIVTKGIPELSRHSLRETPMLDAVEDANNDVILNWIALEGPAALARFVASKDPSIKWPERYVGICHACNEVLTRPETRRVLDEHIDELADYISLHRALFETFRAHEIADSYRRDKPRRRLPVAS